MDGARSRTAGVRALPAAGVILANPCPDKKSRPAKGGFVCDGLSEGYLAA